MLGTETRSAFDGDITALYGNVTAGLVSTFDAAQQQPVPDRSDRREREPLEGIAAVWAFPQVGQGKHLWPLLGQRWFLKLQLQINGWIESRVEAEHCSRSRSIGSAELIARIAQAGFVKAHPQQAFDDDIATGWRQCFTRHELGSSQDEVAAHKSAVDENVANVGAEGRPHPKAGSAVAASIRNQDLRIWDVEPIDLDSTKLEVVRRVVGNACERDDLAKS